MTTVAAGTVASTLIKQFNVRGNDNKARGRGWTTRVVLGLAETKKILAEVKKLPAAKQKAVLSVIAGRVDHKGRTVGKIYIQRPAADLFTKLAQELGLKKSFVGVAAPPMVMG